MESNLQEIMSDGLSEIAKADEALKEAFSVHRSIVSPINTKHQKLMYEFRNAVNDELRKEAEGTLDLYIRYYLKEDGIVLVNDADHPYDIMTGEWTWQEVEEKLGKEKIAEIFNENI